MRHICSTCPLVQCSCMPRRAGLELNVSRDMAHVVTAVSACIQDVRHCGLTWLLLWTSVSLPAGNTKCAQTSDDATFLGLGPHSIIRFDPRIKGGEAGVLVPAAPAADGKGAYKFWDSGPAFTCVVTSGRGYIAAGCEDGSIKLFGSAADDYCYFNSNARSVVEGLGAKITAIDISYDAEYIVATTDKFVMVVKARFRPCATCACKQSSLEDDCEVIDMIVACMRHV